MTLFKKSMTLAAVLAAGVSSAALAQDASVNAGISATNGDDVGSTVAETGVDAGIEAPEMAADAGMGGTGTMTYGNATMAMESGMMTQADYDMITSSTTLNVMGVSGLQSENADDMAAFDNQVAESAAERAAIQGRIAGNAEIVATLEEAGYTADDVVAVWSNADGSFDVLVDDRG